MDSHLVAVEVGIVSGADQRVQTQCTPLDQDRLKRLDAETVQRGRTVEQHGMLLDDVLQRVPDLCALLIDHLLGGLDIVRHAVLDELLHHERAEQLYRHFLGNAALVYLEVRADDYNGTAGIVNALAQKVLTEAALLALEHVGKGFECAGVRAGDGPAAAAVVDERVHGLLKHTLFIAHDDVGRVELLQALEAVVAVYDAAVKVVQVRRGEAAAVELDHGADLRRDDREDVYDHPLGAVAALAEGLDHLKALDELGLLLAGGVLELLTELGGKLSAVYLLQKLLYGLGAYAGLEVVLVLLAHVAVLALGEYLAALQRGEAGVDNYIICKVQHLLQHTRSEVEHEAHAAGYALEVPDVADGGGKLYMAHALTPDLALGDFNAAAVADLALVADLLVLSAVAFPVLRRPENALAEEAVALRLEGAVVDGLRLFHFAVGPFEDLLGGSDTYLNSVKRCIAHHISSSLSKSESLLSVPKSRSAPSSSSGTSSMEKPSDSISSSSDW